MLLQLLLILLFASVPFLLTLRDSISKGISHLYTDVISGFEQTAS